MTMSLFVRSSGMIFPICTGPVGADGTCPGGGTAMGCPGWTTGSATPSCRTTPPFGPGAWAWKISVSFCASSCAPA